MTTSIMDNPINFFTLGRFTQPTSYVESWDRTLPLEYTISSKSISSDANDAFIFLQANNVTIDDITNVETFLTNNSGIIAHLYDVPKKVSEYFGDVKLKLSMFSDPEQENDFQQIFFEIDTSLAPKDANKKLSELNRNWLFGIKDTDICLLNFSLNFI